MVFLSFRWVYFTLCKWFLDILLQTFITFEHIAPLNDCHGQRILHQQMYKKLTSPDMLRSEWQKRKVVRIIRKPWGAGGLQKNSQPLIVFCGTLCYLLQILLAGFSALCSLFFNIFEQWLLLTGVWQHILYDFFCPSLSMPYFFLYSILACLEQMGQVNRCCLFLSLSLLFPPSFFRSIFFFWISFLMLNSCQEYYIWAAILFEKTVCIVLCNI